MKKTILNYCVFLFLVAGCGKDAPLLPLPGEDPCLSEADQEFKIKIGYQFGDQPFNYGTVYTLDNGMRVSFVGAKLYLSEFSLENELINTSKEDKILLAGPGSETVSLGKIPFGTYDTLNFAFGLDSTINHGDPSVYPAGHPLTFSSPSMHWSWSQGYLFARIEGQYDPVEITGSHPGSNFYFHVGEPLNQRMTYIKIPYPSSISACGDNTFKLTIDMKKAFTNIDLETENNTMSISNEVLNQKIRDNLVSGISAAQ